MKSTFLSALLLFALSSCVLAQESQVRTYLLKSEIFDNERLLRVYVPADYNRSEALNVLYLNDGQNALGTDSLGRREDWKVDEIADSLIQNGVIPPMVIVGIDNIGMTHRGNEYLPWEDVYLSPPIPEPEGKKYPEFVVNEVMPFIESRIRVKHEGAGVGIGGFSYGGLSAVYVAMSYPDRFGVLLAETPSLYVDEQRILRVAEASGTTWPQRVYMGVGTNELELERCPEDQEDNRMAVADVQRLISIVKRNAPQTLTKLQVTKCGIHSFEAASLRLEAALKFLYGSSS